MTQVETPMARTEVRPFRIDVPEEELLDLRRPAPARDGLSKIDRKLS